MPATGSASGMAAAALGTTAEGMANPPTARIAATMSDVRLIIAAILRPGSTRVRQTMVPVRAIARTPPAA